MDFSPNNLYLNYDLIKDKIADMQKAISVLRRVGEQSREDFLHDEIVVSGAKYQLIVATEAAQSICNHLAARLAKTAPSSYSDCFRVLAENKIISGELAGRLINMAKFRNLLVHQYAKIDNSIVYNILKNEIDDLLNYINELKAFLGEKDKYE